MRTRLVMTALVVLGLPACGDTAGPQVPLIPLAVGTTWVYTGAGADSLDGLPVLLIDSMRILGDTAMDGTRWYEVTSSPTLGGIAGRGFLGARSEGIWFRTITNTGIPSLDQPLDRLYFRYPAHEGDRYEVDPLSYAHPFVVAAIDEPCGTAGLEGCIRYQEDLPSPPRTTFHVKPGLGIVAIEIPGPAVIDSAGHIRQGLTRYDLVPIAAPGP